MNLPRAAEILMNAQGNSYTTGSEWLGELGLAVRAIEVEFSVPADAQVRLNTIIETVKETWPKI
jgi:hypothetical protein